MVVKGKVAHEHLVKFHPDEETHTIHFDDKELHIIYHDTVLETLIAVRKDITAGFMNCGKCF